MPRPSAKKAAEDKNKVPAPVAAAPQMPPQPMMPTGMPPQGMPMQHQHQHRPQQQQQFMPQVQMPQQAPPPVGVPSMQPQPGRTVDAESFVTVRDSVRLPSHTSPSLCTIHAAPGKNLCYRRHSLGIFARLPSSDDAWCYGNGSDEDGSRPPSSYPSRLNPTSARV